MAATPRQQGDVFQRTVDYPGEWATATTSCWTLRSWCQCGGTK